MQQSWERAVEGSWSTFAQTSGEFFAKEQAREVRQEFTVATQKLNRTWQISYTFSRTHYEVRLIVEDRDGIDSEIHSRPGFCDGWSCLGISKIAMPGQIIW